MTKKATSKRPTVPKPSPDIAAARARLAEARQLKSLHRGIAAAVRGVERSQDAANVRLERLVSVYAERLDKVFVDRATWNAIRDQNADLIERLRLLSKLPALDPREVAGAATA